MREQPRRANQRIDVRMMAAGMDAAVYRLRMRRNVQRVQFAHERDRRARPPCIQIRPEASDGQAAFHFQAIAFQTIRRILARLHFAVAELGHAPEFLSVFDEHILVGFS